MFCLGSLLQHAPPPFPRYPCRPSLRGYQCVSGEVLVSANVMGRCFLWQVCLLLIRLHPSDGPPWSREGGHWSTSASQRGPAREIFTSGFYSRSTLWALQPILGSFTYPTLKWPNVQKLHGRCWSLKYLQPWPHSPFVACAPHTARLQQQQLPPGSPRSQ